MGAVGYRENRAGIAAMAATPEMAKALEHTADLIRIRAEQIAPVDTGAYAFGLDGKPGVRGGGFKISSGVEAGRAFAKVSNDVRAKPSKNFPSGYVYSIGLEFGNKRIRKQRILGRALDAVTGRLA